MTVKDNAQSGSEPPVSVRPVPHPSGQSASEPELKSQVEQRIAGLEDASLDVAARTLEGIDADIRRVLEEIR